MSQRRTFPLFAVTLLLAFAGFDSAAQPTVPPIRRIDHIMVRADDPAKVYAFFTDVLQLPVAWPLMSPREGVATGGVGFGNVNVEAIRFPGQKVQPAGAQLLGFAFEPGPLAASLAELDRRGITYAAPRPLIATGKDGAKNTLWTNVTLRQFSDGEAADASVHVFLSEYSPTYVNVDERRARLRAQLAASGGGPMGVEDVKEVVFGVTDLKAARSLWQRLLDPAPVSDSNTFQVGDGPSIRLVQARDNATQGLVISVTSLRRAKEFLREKGLLGAESDEEATIDPSRIHGLNIRVVEKTPRLDHALGIYDAQLRRVVKIGSAQPAVADQRDRMWSWSGAAWEAVSENGPLARTNGAAAYLSGRNRIGGSRRPSADARFEVSGDTWLGDRNGWSRIADMPARDHHALADNGRGGALLFGGIRPGPWPADTWELQADAWRQVASEGPGARARSAMVYDSKRQQIVLFGGVSAPAPPNQQQTFLNDTWIWDGSRWRQAAANGPRGRYAHGMVLDERNDVVLLYGGAAAFKNAPLSDMWKWDGKRWTEIALSGPTPGYRYQPVMVYDKARGRTVLYGGSGSPSDTWEWDGDRWQRIS
jgi:catechol 2,3-dioxygenase-like lactoylglutathione lyase family enzyme